MTSTRSVLAMLFASVFAVAAFGADAQVVASKLKAKYSAKKITVKGKVQAAGDWPVTLKAELIDAHDNVVASASDTLRGSGPFEMELPAARGHKFDREAMAQARVRYSLVKAKKEEGEETVALRELCPKLTKKKSGWWPW